MNNALFQQAHDAYENEDYSQALQLFNACAQDTNYPLQAGEFGLVFHQLGNCFVKMGNYSDAIAAYSSASSDASYVANGTVYYNLGMAYAYMNDFANAIPNFQTAVNNPNYKSKYKAYTAMGNALMKSGKSAEAGSVFRSAALDSNNPDPTRALLNLGVCFMALGRCDDAVTVYESAFQFNTKPDVKNRLYANLGQAYVATGHMQSAVNAFENALKDKTYVLSDSASVDYQRAIASVSKGNQDIDLSSEGFQAAAASGMMTNVNQGSQVSDNNLNAAPVDSASSGLATQVVSELSNMDAYEAVSNNQPLNNDTSSIDVNDIDSQNQNAAFFSNWSKQSHNAAYVTQRKKSPLKIVLIIALSFVAIVLIVCALLYALGFGIPMQENVVTTFFANPTTAKEQVFSSTVTDKKANSYCAMIYPDNNAIINSVNRAISESTVYVTSKNSSGTDMCYKVKMTRDLLGWKIANVDFAFASLEN